MVKSSTRHLRNASVTQTAASQALASPRRNSTLVGENPLSETELPFQKLLSETAFRNCHDLFRNCGFFETETLFRFSFKSQLHTIVGVRPYLAMPGLRRFEAALSRVGVVMEVSGLTSVGMVSHCTCLIQVCQYCSNVGVRPYLGRKGFDCRCPALHRTYTRVSSFSGVLMYVSGLISVGLVFHCMSLFQVCRVAF